MLHRKGYGIDTAVRGLRTRQPDRHNRLLASQAVPPDGRAMARRDQGTLARMPGETLLRWSGDYDQTCGRGPADSKRLRTCKIPSLQYEGCQAASSGLASGVQRFWGPRR